MRKITKLYLKTVYSVLAFSFSVEAANPSWGDLPLPPIGDIGSAWGSFNAERTFSDIKLKWFNTTGQDCTQSIDYTYHIHIDRILSVT